MNKTVLNCDVGWNNLEVSMNSINCKITIDSILTVKIPSSMYNLYYYSENTKIDVESECKIMITVKKSSYAEAINNVDMWKLRRMFNIRLTKYYINKLFKGEHQFKLKIDSCSAVLDNPYMFDKHINNKKKKIGNIIKVLYLISFSPVYEHIGYTVRTHNIIKNVDDRIKMYGATQYGYPYCRPVEYYYGKEDSCMYDNIMYRKILSKTDITDNVNNNTIVDFLQKCIDYTTELASELDVDIIHGVTDYVNGVSAVYAAKNLGIKSVYEVRGFWNESTVAFKPHLKGSDILEMKDKLENVVLNRADHIITINKYLKNSVVGRLNGNSKNIHVLYNSVDTNVFSFDATVRNKVRNKLGVSKNTVVIGYIGSILIYEGIEYILQTVKKMVELELNPLFILVGDGTEKNSILQQITDLNIDNYVKYLGKLPHEETVDIYNAFDIVAYPRKDMEVCRTTSSLKVFEAMSFSLPVVVSKLDAWTEIVVDGKNGLYCAPDNVNSLTDAVVKLYKDTNLRKKLGSEGRKWVVSNRCWNKIGKQLSDIYTGIVK